MLSLTGACSTRQLVTTPSQTQLAASGVLHVRGSQRSLHHRPSEFQSHHSPDGRRRSPSFREVDVGTQTSDFGTNITLKSDSFLPESHGNQLQVGTGLPKQRTTISNLNGYFHSSLTPPADANRDHDASSADHEVRPVEYDETQLQRPSAAKKSQVRPSAPFGSFFVADSPSPSTRHSHGSYLPADPALGKRERPSTFHLPSQHEMLAGENAQHRDLSPVDENADSTGVLKAHRRETLSVNENYPHRTASDLDRRIHVVSDEEEDPPFDVERDGDSHALSAFGRYRKRRMPSTASGYQYSARYSARDLHGIGGNGETQSDMVPERASYYSRQASIGHQDDVDSECAEGGVDAQLDDNNLYLPKVVRLLISSLCTYLVLAVFCFVWALIFMKAESTSNPNLLAERKRAASQLLKFLQNSTPVLKDDLVMEEWVNKSSWHQELEGYTKAVIGTYKLGLMGDNKQEWSISHSLVFVETVVTTIGYGHIYPRTVIGRALTIFCSLGGVPLFCLTVNELGSLLAHVAKLVIVLLHNDCAVGPLHKGRTVRTTTVEIKLWMAIFLLPAFLAALAGISYAIGLENADPADFFTSFYWMFITLSTIGFGDIVPAKDTEYLLLSLPILAGCGLFAMVVNKVMLKYVEIGCVLRNWLVRQHTSICRALRKSRECRRNRKRRRPEKLDAHSQQQKRERNESSGSDLGRVEGSSLSDDPKRRDLRLLMTSTDKGLIEIDRLNRIADADNQLLCVATDTDTDQQTHSDSRANSSESGSS